nr:MAG TPA: hypothetical protein [Caudoviricetes sp.]
MKFVNKADVEFKRGYFTVDGEIVHPGTDFVGEIHTLDYLNKLMLFVDAHEEEIDAASGNVEMPRFEYKEPKVRYSNKEETPKLDAYVKNIEEIFDELDDVKNAKLFSTIADKYFSKLIEFVGNDDFVVVENTRAITPMPMDVLDLTNEKLEKFLAAIVETRMDMVKVDPEIVSLLPALYSME